MVTFIVDSTFKYFHETNMNHWFLGVTQKRELGVAFNVMENIKRFFKKFYCFILLSFIFIIKICYS